MGLGRGIKCRICDSQLYYGDGAITTIDNILVCSRCKLIITRFKDESEEIDDR
jgi:hypothetical protein